MGSDGLSKGRRRITFAISGSWPTMRMRPTHPASSAAPRFSFNRCTSSITTSAICGHRLCRHGGSQQCTMCLLLACNGMQPCRSDRSPLQRSSSRPDPFAFSSRCLRSSISLNPTQRHKDSYRCELSLLLCAPIPPLGLLRPAI